MTESLFDPTGPETEHSGTRNLGPEAGNLSQMPPDAVDGTVEDADATSPDADALTEQIARVKSEAHDPNSDRLNPDR